MIPPRNLSLLANRLAQAGGRRLPEAVLERHYCLAWFLVALSRVYSLGEIMAEKVVALTDRARNEPRDLYDVWHLVDRAEVGLSRHEAG